MKAKMQSAADAASLASISMHSAGYRGDTDDVERYGVCGCHRRQQHLQRQRLGRPGLHEPLVDQHGHQDEGDPEIQHPVQRAGADHIPGPDRISEPDHHRQFVGQRLAAALSRLLSDAGRFRLDGPAVDDGRSPADAVGQSGQLSAISHRLHPRLPFSAVEQRVHRYRDARLPDRQPVSGLRDLACEPERLPDLLVLQSPQGKYPFKNPTTGKYQQLPTTITSATNPINSLMRRSRRLRTARRTAPTPVSSYASMRSATP